MMLGTYTACLTIATQHTHTRFTFIIIFEQSPREKRKKVNEYKN